MTSSGARTVLVDTSLLLEQQKSGQRRDPVRRALARFRFRGASSYSKLEFKRAWIQRLAMIHAICSQPQTKSFAHVLDRIDSASVHPRKKRQLQTCVQMLAAFFDLPSSPSRPEGDVARLKAYCRRAVLGSAESMRQMVTGEFRGTGCIRAEELPEERRDGSVDVAIRQCRPHDIKCRVHEFFIEHRGTFLQIASHITGLPAPSAQLLAIKQHIEQANVEPTHLCDNRCCAKVADALIAIDGRNMDVLAANNDAEWVPLARVLNRPLMNPVSGRSYAAPAPATR